MRAIYPSRSKTIETELREAAEREKAAVKSYDVPPLVEIAASTWLGRPLLSPSLTATLQSNHDVAKQKAQNQRTNPASASIVAKESLTNTQQALYRETLQTT